LATLPAALIHCKQLSFLDVTDNPLQTLPECLAELPNLEILFARNTQLTSLPPVLVRCHKLHMLGVANNKLQSLDGEQLPESLVWLIAAGNEISQLKNMSRLKHIRKLMLSHNKLTSDALATVAGIEDLEMIRVAANCLEEFPAVLFEHPRLAWVAVGGNPFAEKTLQQRLASGATVADVRFDDVTLGESLGRGAGATVYRGRWADQDVAVKLWEGEQFSDGTARGEWGVNRVAGSPGHPSLVAVRGAFEAPRPGMLLELLPEARAAAQGPSFQTVTRDCLPRDGGSGPQYRPGSAATVAQAVAQACEYLQTKGVYHGDVYLHNTLVLAVKAAELAAQRGGVLAEVRDARLSDFGAAAVVDDPRFELLEVRSFGWLLQDLLDSLSGPAQGPDEEAQVNTLRQLRARCAAATTSCPCGFGELVRALRKRPFAAL